MGRTARLLRRRISGRQLGELLAMLRYLLYRRAGRIVGGRRLADLPARFVDSLLSTEGTRRSVVAHLDEVHQLDDACIATYQLPDDVPASFHRKKAFDPRYLFRMNDVVVSPFSGMTWLPSDGRVIGDSVGSLYRTIGWGNVAHEILMPVMDIDDGGPLVASVSRNPAHWLFESLPNLLVALQHVPDARILLPGDPRRRPDFVLESLRRALGPQHDASLIRFASGPIRAKDVVLVQMPRDPFFVHPGSLKLLRTTFLGPGQAPVSTASRMRLYVSRSRTTKRRLTNELRVHDMVAAAGFQVVHLEDLDFGERITMFRAAEIVMGPHGAGLAGIIWCDAGSRLIELLPHEWYNGYYARLAVSLGLRYDWLQCHPDRGGDNELDLLQLERLLESLPADTSRSPHGPRSRR